jgi:LmbE family N-acetylglucosaminyl deacetylase
MSERVLVVAPHPDDEAIGCGGTLCLHRRRGDPVHVVFLTSGEQGVEDMPGAAARAAREAEARAAARVLDLSGVDFLHLPDQGVGRQLERGARLLRKVLGRHRPDVIYLPHPEESHPDHEAALPLVRQALAGLPGGAAGADLRGYEVWSPLTRHDWVEVVSEVMGQKLRAVRCYRSQLRPFRYDLAVRGLNRYRGILAGRCRYAEAFVSLDPDAGV